MPGGAAGHSAVLRAHVGPLGPGFGLLRCPRWARGASAVARFVPRSLPPGCRRRGPAPRFGGPSPPARPAGRPPCPALLRSRSARRAVAGFSAWALALALGWLWPPCSVGLACPRALAVASAPPPGPPLARPRLRARVPSLVAPRGGRPPLAAFFRLSPPRGWGFGAVIPRGACGSRRVPIEGTPAWPLRRRAARLRGRLPLCRARLRPRGVHTDTISGGRILTNREYLAA